MGDVYPAITKTQIDYAERMLINISRRQIELAQCIKLVESLLDDNDDDTNTTSPITKKTIKAANNNNPSMQAALYANHEDMIESFDSYAQSICYLLKIRNFLPHLLKEFGPVYHYSISVGEKLQSNTINLMMFSGNGEPAVQELWSYASTVYGYLAQLQHKMTDDTIEHVIQNNKASEFLQKFCQNRPPEMQDCLGRIEYLFFTEHNVPLGIFADASDHILKWIQRKNFDSIMTPHTGDISRHFKHARNFLGVVLVPDTSHGSITTSGKFSLAHGLIGTIPENGIIIEHDQKPKPEYHNGFPKPHLIS